MVNSKLSIHHIGARGDGQPFPTNPVFESSIINVLYEADPEGIDEILKCNNQRMANVIILNECVSGKAGSRTFCDAYSAFGSSLLEANSEFTSLYLSPSWVDWDHTVYDAISAKNRRQVNTKTLDQIAKTNCIPLPDFLSLDTQGSELEIFQGAPDAINSAVCIITEVEFLPIYEGQPLFGDICSFLCKKGFLFAKFFRMLNGSLYRAPLGLRGEGVAVTTDSLFLRNPITIVKDNISSAEKAVRLCKLAFFSLYLGYIEHSIWSLNEAQIYNWKNLNLSEGWYGFMLNFYEHISAFPNLLPHTFAEQVQDGKYYKYKFLTKAKQNINQVNDKLTALLHFLQDHHFNEAVESITRQYNKDLLRLKVELK